MRCCSPTSGPADAGSAGRASWPRAPALRPSCCCAADSDPAVARDAVALGAFTVQPRGPRVRGVHARAGRRRAAPGACARPVALEPAGRETQRFGDAFVRGYRCIRRLASGATTDLYLGESERAGTLVVLKVARDRRDEHDAAHRCVPALPAGIRDRPAHRQPRGGAPLRSGGERRARLAGHGVLRARGPAPAHARGLDAARGAALSPPRSPARSPRCTPPACCTGT